MSKFNKSGNTAPPAPIGEPFAVDDLKLAPMLGLSVAMLRKDRRTARTIPFFTIGRAVRYDVATVRQAMLARQMGGQR